MALLTVQHLTKRYVADHDPAVEDVAFTVNPGEIMVLLGPSGCGKTTALRLIAGFENADRGNIVLEGRILTMTKGCSGAPGLKPVHIRPEKRNIGFVFQEYALFPHMNVLRNVMYGLHGWRAKRKARAKEVLDLVGMADYAQRKPHELSGGQQQRVALARSLGPSPKLILMDEPFSNLDAALRESTRLEVRKLFQEQNMAAILVTHDQEEALSFGDRIAVMNEGHVEQIGKPTDVYERPSTPFVATFLGRTNLLKLDAVGNEAPSPFGRIQLDRQAAGTVTVSIRPEHLRITEPHHAGCKGRVVSREYKGHDLTYRVQVDDQTFIIQTDYRCTFKPGDRVCVQAPERAVVVKNGHDSVA